MTADGPKSAIGVDFSAHRRGSANQWDAKIAAIAARQHGLVCLAQLQKLGMGRGTAHHRIRIGALHCIHQGVFAVGHPLQTQESRWMATALACGPRAVLSHQSAAALWGIRDERRVTVDVTAPGRRGRAPTGIDAHRHGSLTPSDRSSHRGVPCTTVSRTLLDLAAVVPIAELQRAIAEAEVLGLFDVTQMRRLIRRARGRRGVARLRMLVDGLDPVIKHTRSELERRFLSLCRRAGPPQPEVNALLDLGDARIRPDFLWRDARLIVETDGRHYHDTRSAFEADRRRAQRLQLAGWRVAPCTWSQVVKEPRALATVIRGLLSQPPADGPIS